ncbi:MAG: PKD domain-containing protein [Parafilimonas sp.]
MKYKYIFLTVSVSLFVFNYTRCQYLEFAENKGQWNSKVNFKAEINGGSLYLQPQGYKVVLHNGKELEEISDYFSGHSMHHDSAQLNKLSAAKTLLLHSHAYEVTFLDALSNIKPEPDKPLNTYNNYFIGNDSSKWASHCRIFSAVNYKNIYPNVDVRYYADNGNLKYDLIIKPGADINKIALKFDGADGLEVNKYGNLVIKTSVGEAYELKPYSYQLNETGRSKIDAKFTVTGNIVKFKLGNYSKTSTIIIDPALIFSTFVGSKTDNWGYTATYDNSGNFYAGGIAFGQGYPASPGAYDETFNGGDNSEGTGPYDVAIIKLSSDGTQRIYATYLGGAGTEQPHSMIVDLNGELVISGRTFSSNFPITTATNFGPCGSFDIFLSKLSADGTSLVSSRKFGGTGDDGVNIRPKYIGAQGDESLRRNYGDDARSEVITDYNDNIYLASCTQSTNFPTANAFKTSLSGRQDGVLIKASPDLNTIYASTYIGGNGDDAAFVLTLNPQNNDIYIAGGTTSTNLPTNTSANGIILSNSFQGGICDGFISVITNDGRILKKTVYAGTGGNDLIYGIQFDKSGNPYIMGTTTVSFPVLNAGFNTQTGGKQFITKIEPGLDKVVYSTNFGKQPSSVPDISPTAFLVDVCENVYVSGWGGGIDRGDGYPNAGTTGLSLTPNAIVKITDGADFYFFVLKKDGASQLYGSYFGTDARNDPSVLGDHVDGGTSRFDKRGVIYQAICANCGKNGLFPTSPPNVWSPGNPALTGSQCNEAAVKIAFELAGVISSIQTSINGVLRDSSGCIPLTVMFTDTVALGKSYIWNFGDGSAPVTTTIPTISHTYVAVGDYRVMLVAVDSSTCNISDTSYVTIRARDNKALLSFTQTKLLPCDSLNYQFNNTSVAPIGFPFGLNSFTWNFGDGATLVSNASSVFHTYAAPGTYNIRLYLTDTTYCNAPDSAVLQLRASPILVAQFVTPAVGCAPYNAFFDNTSLGGQSFVWDFGDGSPTSTEVSPTHLYTNTGTYTITLNATDNSTCNTTDDTSITINIYSAPTAVFQFGPPKENEPLQFINLSTGAVKYRWDFGDGDTLITNRLDTPVNHIYNKTGNYKACLTATNEFGCSDDTCQEISAIVLPLLDVPTAFTPNGDNVNDVVRVRGFGIDKFNWRIYNRWGALVFQANSINQAWDGKYKGALQPMEVYAYILDVTFTDMTQYRKKGDITLIR